MRTIPVESIIVKEKKVIVINCFNGKAIIFLAYFFNILYIYTAERPAYGCTLVHSL